VTVNRDAHYTPRMLKRALIAGLPSAGVNVADLQSVPIPVARYFTAASGAVGGIHVRLSPMDNRVVDIKFFDSRGLDIDSAGERKVEMIYFREDYRRVYLDEVARINYAERVDQVYSDAFIKALRPEALEPMRHYNIVVDYASANAISILGKLLRHLGVNTVDLNSTLDEDKLFQTQQDYEDAMRRLGQLTPVLGACMGVRLDSGGERIYLVNDLGAELEGTRALAMLTALMMQVSGGGTVAVPVTAPRIFEDLAARHGGQIVRTKATLGALMQTAAENPHFLLLGDGAGNFIFPSFYPIADGLFAVAKILEQLALHGTSISAVERQIPPFYIDQTRVPCRWEHKGKVMRILNQQYEDRKLEQVDGIKIDLGDEWVLILPDPDGPFFTIIAEGSSQVQARVLIQKYAGLVSGLQ
jgi:mannose-1-phosphate guanylyltransferase/phosphomannomutase